MNNGNKWKGERHEELKKGKTFSKEHCLSIEQRIEVRGQFDLLFCCLPAKNAKRIIKIQDE